VLVGRDAVLDRAVSGMLAGPSDPWFTHAYFGERGVGKTVLLDEIGGQVGRHGWVVAHAAVRAGGFLAPLLEVELVDAAQRLSRRIRPSWLDTEGAWRAGGSLGAAPGPVVQAERTRARGYRLSPASAVELALTSLGEAAERKRIGLLITLDEVHAADHDELSMLSAAMQLISKRRRLPVALVAAGLPNLPEVLTGPDLTFLERMSKAPLGFLEPAAARLALAGPFATGGGIDEEALAQLVGASGGYPYLVQLLGYQAWAAAGGSRVTKRHATTAVGEAAAVAGTGVFGPRWGRLAPKEREFVAAMAQLGDGPVAVSEVRRLLGVQRYEDVSYLRRRLLAKGIIRSTGHGQLVLALPMFSRWVRSHQ
jgi:hypothetical protein